MNEKKDVYEKVKSEMRLSERILAELPGFRGYKEKELRREADKLIRNHLYRRLVEAKNAVKDAFQELSENRRYEVLNDVDKLVMKFDRIAEKINHASYGYAGFFDAVKIEENDLDHMIKFDNALLEQVKEITEAATAFKKETLERKYEKAKERVQKLRALVEELERTFDQRAETIRGVM